MTEINSGFIEKLILEYRTKPSFPENYILFTEHPEWIPALWETVKSNKEHPFPEYAAWWWLHIGLERSDLITSYQNEMIDLALVNNNQSVLRSIVRVLSTLPTSPYRETEWLEKLISFLENHDNKVALQVYALYTLVGFVKLYPDLTSEIDTLLQFKEELGLQPAMKVGIRKFRKAIANKKK